MHPASRVAAPIVILGLVLGACGTGDPSPDTPGDGGPISHPTGAGDLVLRVETTGGFVPLEEIERRVPGFSLFGDGTIVVEGPQIEIYPPPAVPPLLVRSVDEAGIQAILVAARDAGLFADRSWDHAPVSDAPSTAFTVVADGGRFETEAYALGFGPATADMSDEERRARRTLTRFQNQIGDLGSLVPQGSEVPETPYRPTAMRLFVTPVRTDPNVPQRPVPWPLRQPPPEVGGASACFVVRGGGLEALLPVLTRTNQLTPWDHDGRLFGLVARPLLPDEAGC